MSGHRQHRLVCIELGRQTYTPSQLPQLARGAVVRLQERAEDPVNVYADGCLLARGQLTLLDGRVGVRITEVFATSGDRLAQPPTPDARVARSCAADLGRRLDFEHFDQPLR
jgi:hypothetical protein